MYRWDVRNAYGSPVGEGIYVASTPEEALEAAQPGATAAGVSLELAPAQAGGVRFYAVLRGERVGEVQLRIESADDIVASREFQLAAMA